MRSGKALRFSVFPAWEEHERGLTGGEVVYGIERHEVSRAADFRGLCCVPYYCRISDNSHGQCELRCAKRCVIIRGTIEFLERLDG